MATISSTTPKKQTVQEAFTGSGSVDALYATLDKIVEEQLELVDYQISSVGRGRDALAESRVQLIVNGEHMNGRGTAQDVIEASANAFLNAVNRYVIQKQSEEKRKITNV